MFIDIIIILIGILNTLVRLLPVALYTGTIISNIVFDDFRANLLFIGFLINEMLAFAYKFALKGTDKAECALLADPSNYYVLPSPITQTIGFFFGFIMTDVYFSNSFKSLKFIVMCIVLALTIFSRINVGCETTMNALIFACVGTGFGVIYYYIIKDYYKSNIEDVELDTSFYQ
jgi:hypothetical protein